MRFIFLSALKDLRRMRHDPLTLATWIGTPVLVSLLLVAFFGHEQPKPQGLVLIADQDKTFLSALVMHAYTQDKLGEMFTVQQVPLQEGRRRINSGDGSALVIIPKGLSKAVLGKQEAKIQLITNPSQSIMPSIVESVTSSWWRGSGACSSSPEMICTSSPTMSRHRMQTFRHGVFGLAICSPTCANIWIRR